MCANEWEATWEVSWIQGCTQRGVICPSHAGARVHTSTQSLIPWLSSAAVSSSPLHHPWSAAGSPQQSSCRDGAGRWQWDESTSRKGCEGRWSSSSRSHDFASSSCWNKEPWSWVGQAVPSLLLESECLQTPWLTRCPSSSSARVGSKVKPRFASTAFCVTFPRKSCQQLPRGWSAAGSSGWGCVGKALRPAPGNNYKTSW